MVFDAHESFALFVYGIVVRNVGGIEIVVTRIHVRPERMIAQGGRRYISRESKDLRRNEKKGQPKGKLEIVYIYIYIFMYAWR